MGSSGSGKSTLLNILGILDSFNNGSYLIEGQSIDGFDDTEKAHFRGKTFGFVFQSFNLLPQRSALENVSLPLYYQGVPFKERQSRAFFYLKKLGLADRASHLPDELSGGQKQRVAIARALVAEPKVILADEPTGALDSKTSQDILEILKALNTEGKTIILVTHEKHIALQTKRIISITDGKITSDSPNPKTELTTPHEEIF